MTKHSQILPQHQAIAVLKERGKKGKNESKNKRIVNITHCNLPMEYPQHLGMGYMV